jgi:putative flippase GtrA
MIDRLRKILAHDDMRKLILYALCGGSGVLLDFAAYMALLAFEVNYQVANACGYFAGTLLSFALNRHFTFQTYDNTLRRLAMFFAAAGVGYLISTIVLWLLIERIGLNPLLAKIATLGVVLVVQFSLNRAITFRQR